MREALADLLAISGFDVATAVSGEEGAKLFQTSKMPYQFLISSVRSLQDSTLDLLPQFQQQNPHLQIIITSSFDENELRPFLPHTAVHLRKPFNGRTLLKLLETH